MKIDWLAMYQKSLLGGLGGLLGWALLALFVAPSGNEFLDALIRGALVGLPVGAACGIWDGLFRNRSSKRMVIGAAVGAAIGLAGGAAGLLLGQLLSYVGRQVTTAAGWELMVRALGWGLFGAAVGMGDGIARRMHFQTLAGAYGGFLGGLVGGSTYQWIADRAEQIFSRGTAVAVGGAVGLVLLGLFVGAFMGLVEDLLRAAWLVFTSGRLEGQTRTLDPAKAVTRIGRSDGAEICILADPKLAPVHARITATGGRFAIEAVDGQVLHGSGPKLAPVTQQPLSAGDMIQLGGNRAQFFVGGAGT